ncbi:MAG: hypothetical protein AAFX65_00230 [Cyanobacteria bacterium J06638_7]
MVSDHPQHHEGAATPSTVLKWSSDGELSPLDLQQLVDRLQRADPVAQELLHPSHFSALNPHSC